MRPPLILTCLAAAGVLSLTACGSGGGSSGNAAATAAPSVSVSVSVSPSVSPSPVTTGTSPATSPSASPSGGSQCSGAQLHVAEHAASAATGHEGVVLLFRNTGSTPCTIYGFPGAAGLDNGKQVLQAQRTPSGYLGGLRPGRSAPVVTLAAGDTASAMLEGSDVPRGTQTSCPTLTALLVTPPNTTTSVHLDIAPPACGGLQVHPVVPGTTGRQAA